VSVHQFAMSKLKLGVYLFPHPQHPYIKIECMCGDCQAVRKMDGRLPTYWYDEGQEPVT
jgi:hypothetical protein